MGGPLVVLVTESYPTPLRPHGLEPVMFFCPWDSPGKSTGVGSLLQGIFPTQGSNQSLLHWQADSLPPEPLGNSIRYKGMLLLLLLSHFSHVQLCATPQTAAL